MIRSNRGRVVPASVVATRRTARDDKADKRGPTKGVIDGPSNARPPNDKSTRPTKGFRTYTMNHYPSEVLAPLWIYHSPVMENQAANLRSRGAAGRPQPRPGEKPAG